MRTLLLFRGSPGCGKTTFIKKHNLEPFTLSPDNIRMMVSSLVLNNDGELSIAANNEGFVWDLLFQILEKRMENGDFTVIDATNSKTGEMNAYKKLADKYRYRIYLIDMTEIDVDVVKHRNKARDPYKRVPDEVIDRMYARFDNQKVPAGITVLKMHQLDEIWIKPVDISECEKLFVIGDIHGCYNPLEEFLNKFKPEENPKHSFIFLGDLIDRGLQNAEVVKKMMELVKLPNVFIVEGNHERWLARWARDEETPSSVFNKYTKVELDAAGISKKEVRKFCRKFLQCSYMTYKEGKYKFFICHGGIPKIEDNRGLSFVPTEQLIKGVGRYKEYKDIASTWHKLMGDSYFQIFGHRNTERSPIQVEDNVFDLEGNIEFGGHLRAVCFDFTKEDLAITPYEFKNDYFKNWDHQDENDVIGDKKYDFSVEVTKDTPVEDIVLGLRLSRKQIKEKQFGDISSFNFSREVFTSGNFNSMNIKARGLFIDTVKNKIIARSYNKFFNIEEREETYMKNLRNTLVFPLRGYVKENGYLCMLSVYDDKLFFATKSDCGEGPYKVQFENTVRKMIDDGKIDENKLIKFLKDNDVTMVFENVDNEFDPHIIEYNQKELYLLDIVRNNIVFSKYDYKDLCKVAEEFNFSHKIFAQKFSSFSEFQCWYNDVTEKYDYEDFVTSRIVEGYVFEDATGFMTKFKLPYYKFWKRMRSFVPKIIATGNVQDTTAFYNPMSIYFYGFLRELVSNYVTKEEREEHIPNNIIELRRMFFASDKYKEMTSKFKKLY